MRQVLETALAEEVPGEDALARLASLDAPTGDIHEVLSEIEAGRR